MLTQGSIKYPFFFFFWVFGMTRPGIETWSPEPLINTLTIMSIHASLCTSHDWSRSSCKRYFAQLAWAVELLWPQKGSLMKTQTGILDNRLYYTRKIELHRKGKKSRTVQITPILICPLAAKSLVLITVRRVYYGEMGKAATTRIHRLHLCRGR